MKHIWFCALALAASPLAAERSYTFVGPNGATSEGTLTCQKVEGTIVCDRAATLTGADGLVLDRQGNRVVNREGSALTLTTTGPNGRVVTTTRLRDR